MGFPTDDFLVAFFCLFKATGFVWGYLTPIFLQCQSLFLAKSVFCTM